VIVEKLIELFGLARRDGSVVRDQCNAFIVPIILKT